MIAFGSDKIDPSKSSAEKPKFNKNAQIKIKEKILYDTCVTVIDETVKRRSKAAK